MVTVVNNTVLRICIFDTAELILEVLRTRKSLGLCMMTGLTRLIIVVYGKSFMIKKLTQKLHILLLTSYWPELSYVATFSCKGIWEMYCLDGWLEILLFEEKENGRWLITNSLCHIHLLFQQF